MKDASQSGWVIDVSDADFEEEVVERSKTVPVVLDFWAPWCGPCRTLGPILERVAEAKAGEFILAKINIDESPELAGYFQIEGVPTVHAVREGQIVPGFVGLPSEKDIKDFFDRLKPSETESDLKTAQDLETTDPAKAESIYRATLAENPNSELARVGLARLLVSQHKLAEANELLAPLDSSGEQGAESERLRRIIELEGNAPASSSEERELRTKIETDPENAQLRFELGALLASRNNYAEALEMLLSAAERDKKLAQNQVRELMVKIFQIIGIRSEMSDDYRSRLQSLLY